MSYVFPHTQVPGELRDTVTHDVMHGPVYQAYRILQVAFIAAPIIAGLDKFFDKLTNWERYLSPTANRMLNGHGHQFMLAVGVIEIVAGLGVAWRPRIFAYVVCAWLAAIIINLLMVPGFYDIALRDLGLCMAAFALGRLAQRYDHPVTTTIS